MKLRYLITLLVLYPCMAISGMSEDMRMQMLDSEIEKLTTERNQKYADLKQCEQTTKGFKIAGIATLVGTGVGVYGNIKIAQNLKNNGSAGGRGGGGDFGVPDKTQEQKMSDQCKALCVRAPVLAKKYKCNC